MGLRLSVLAGRWAIARLGPGEPVPEWAGGASGFASVTRTPDELSIVCPEELVPTGVRAERGWVLLRLHGPFAFSAVGILASVAGPLAAAGVGLFAVSTFDTDWLLVKAEDREAAVGALAAAGHVFAAQRAQPEVEPPPGGGSIVS